MKNESITDVVKEKYGQAALRVTAGNRVGRPGTSSW